MTTSCINATRLRDAIRTWVGTHKCANILDTLLELLPCAKKPCPTPLLLLLLPDALRNRIADWRRCYNGACGCLLYTSDAADDA